MSAGASPQQTNFPFGFNFGLNVRGMPVLNSYGGNVYWVDSGAGVAGNPGTFQKPVSTIAAALDLCSASNGDIIMVKPGHAESITSAGGLTLDVAGVAIIGLGTGRNRPTLTVSTATSASLLVSAANVCLANFVIDLTGIDALDNGIQVQAADFALVGSEVITASASAQAVLGLLTTAAANRMLLQNNTFVGTTDAGTTAAVRIVGGSGIIIIGNTFFGAYTAGVGAIQGLTTDTTNLSVNGNLINNQTGSSTKAMVFTATSTGMIANNRMQILSGTAPITGAAMSWVGGNYYAATIATAGTLI